MIDTHAHLNFPSLLANVEEIIKRSKEAGVKGAVVASSNLEDSKVSVELAKKHPEFLFASVGLHPQISLISPISLIFSQLEELIRSNLSTVVAIGECGLDYSEEKNEEQEELFLGQIKLAQKYHLPLIVHARDANDEVIEILAGVRNPEFRALNSGFLSDLRGVFHCCSGGKKRISKILNLPGEWYFGFDGNLTYDEGLQQIIKFIPEDRILIETDSPYLTPAPYRGKTNSPIFLPLIQQKINGIFGKNLTLQILKNSRNLFNLDNYHTL